MAIELENTGFNLTTSALGGFLLVFGALSYLIKERLYLGEAPLAVIVGIVLERSGAIPAEFRPAKGEENDPLGEFCLQLSRLVIGVQLVIVGIQLPPKYPKIELRSLAMLLLPVMACMWLVTTGLTMLCFPELPLLAALVIASCMTPTDPVLSNSIVKGSFADQHVSPRLRNLISAESGANDGFGYPFLFLALHLLKSASTGEALQKWVLETILYQVIGSAIFGAIVGIIANRVLRWSTDKNTIDKESFLCYGIAVGIFTVGMAGFLNLDDLLAAFAVGNALTWDDWYRQETENDELQNVMDLLLNTVYFIFVGATIPWDSFHDPENGITVGRLAALAVLVLLLRRVPAMLVFHRGIPCLRNSWSEALFMGYFGPIGAGALFYSSLVLDQFDDPGHALPGVTHQIRTLVRPISYALVISSLLGHTLMIPVVKAFLSWRDIGNIQLLGHEGEHAEDESDAASFYGEGDADRREAENYEAGAGEEEERPGRGDGSTTSDAAMSNVPGGKPASVDYANSNDNYPEGRRRRRREESAGGGGGYHRDGRWNPHASWRISSSHLPSSGHKLGTHLSAEQHERGDAPPIPREWTRRVDDLERRATREERSGSITRDHLRPQLDEHRRQSVV